MAESAEPGSVEYLKKGFEIAVRWKLAGTCPVSPRAGDHCKFDGNQAIALGALLGGCQFMAGYPMSPATSIMHYFTTAALKTHVHFEQAEDEISAINMALGAPMPVVRSMVVYVRPAVFALMQGRGLSGGDDGNADRCRCGSAAWPGPQDFRPNRAGDLNFNPACRPWRISPDYFRPRRHR